MNQDDSKNYIPKHLDNLPRFGLWDVYQSMIFLIVFGFGVAMHLLFYGLVVGGLAAWVYGRLSSGQGRGFLVHLLYWYTPLGDKYKVIPPSNKRFFQG
ncbi:MAG: type IV conjugative transfer system protein TraL [Thiotrichales bacterium]|nr:type IV conjugative transfer system protein TraL [Thiotrichales bacterium]